MEHITDFLLAPWLYLVAGFVFLAFDVTKNIAKDVTIGMVLCFVSFVLWVGGAS